MESISRYPVPELRDLPPDIREAIERVQEKSGFVPNIFLALAHRPDEFRAFFAYHDAILERKGNLSRAAQGFSCPDLTEHPISEPRNHAYAAFPLISIGASYDYGTDGMTHHGTGDVPILKTLPRMEIVVPGTAAEFDSLLRETYVDSAPTYIRLSERQNGLDRPVRFGRLHIEREGRDAVVVAVGPLLDVTLEAVADLDVTVLYATTVTPFDSETLRAVVATTRKAIVLVEPYYEGTLVPEVVAAVAPTPVRVEAIGVPRRILDRYDTAERHDAEIGLTPAGIRSRVERFLRTGID